MQVVRNHKNNYATGDSTWSKNWSLDSRSSYKIPRKMRKFDR